MPIELGCLHLNENRSTNINDTMRHDECGGGNVLTVGPSSALVSESLAISSHKVELNWIKQYLPVLRINFEPLRITLSTLLHQCNLFIVIIR